MSTPTDRRPRRPRRSGWHLSCALLGLALGVAAVGSPPPAPTPPAPRPPAPPASPPPASAGLPSADSIIERAIERMGGRERIAAIESSQIRATMLIPEVGVSAKTIMYAAPDGRILVRQSVSETLSETGSNGQVAWRDPGNGKWELLELDSELIQNAHKQARMHSLLTRIKDEYQAPRTAGRTTFGKTECWEIVMSDHQGLEQSAFFDATAGWLIGFRQQRRMGPPIEVVVDRWRNTDGVSIFTRMVVRQPGMTQTFTVDQVEYGPIDPAIFEPPAPVRELIEQRGRQPDAPGAEGPGAPQPGAGEQ